MTRTANEIRIGDIVRSEHMAADGEWLKDCEVTKSFRTFLGSWVIRWRMVDDETVNGELLTRPDFAIEVVSLAPGGGS